MENLKSDKIMRTLGIYTKLMNGFVVYKAQEAQQYGVNERSIQRDIDDIRSYLEDNSVQTGNMNRVIYDHGLKGYRLEKMCQMNLSNAEVLAICKILLDSRAFTKAEMEGLLEKLIVCCVPEKNRKLIQELIRNEEFHYVELRHKSVFLDKMWKIGQAIQKHRYIEFSYERTKDRKIVKRKVKPLAIMFSEYYFYITAFIDDEDVRKGFDVLNDSFPTIYRMDRIKKLKVLEEGFHIPYRSRFEEGEFRKRIQFMYGGKLQKIVFQYFGTDVDAVLDRLPTAHIVREEKGIYTIAAEVFGKGIEMWLRSQGENVKVLKG